MNMDEKIKVIQDNLARLPCLSRGEFVHVRQETEQLISEVEEELGTDNLEIAFLS